MMPIAVKQTESFLERIMQVMVRAIARKCSTTSCAVQRNQSIQPPMAFDKMKKCLFREDSDCLDAYIEFSR